MTTSQNRQPKGITSGGQFAPDTRAESTLLLDPATRDVILSPGHADTFSELADGEGPAKAVNIKDLITDSDARLHGDTLDLHSGMDPSWKDHKVATLACEAATSSWPFARKTVFVAFHQLRKTAVFSVLACGP
jgi:hypothetical protein